VIRFGKTCSVFASLAVLTAAAVAVTAAPASASPSVCQHGCAMGSPATNGPFFHNDELGMQFSTTVPGYMYDMCYPVAAPESGNDTMTLWNSSGVPISTSTASGGCAYFNNVAMAPGTYTASFTETTDDLVSFGNSFPQTNGPVTGLAGVLNTTAGSFPSSAFGFDYGVSVDFVTAPNAPTVTSVQALSSTAVSVAFTGDGDPSASYTATCTSSFPATVSVSSAASPITVTGLGNKVLNPVTCTVTEAGFSGLPSPPSSPASVLLVGVGGPGECKSTLTAPTKLSSAPGNASATVSWAPATSNPPGCVAGYVVTPSSGSPVLISGPGTTTVLKALQNGTVYTFTVAAENGAVVGPASTSTGPVTIGTPTAPTALQVRRVAKGAINVAFKAPHDNGAAITGYTATCASISAPARSKSANTDPLVVAGLTAGKTYSCTVVATNSRGAGTSSVRSTPITA